MGLTVAFWQRARKLLVSAWDIVSSPFRRTSDVIIADTTSLPISGGTPITGAPPPFNPPGREPQSGGAPPLKPEKTVIFDTDFFRSGGAIPNNMINSVSISNIRFRSVNPIGGMRWNYRVKLIVEKQIGSFLSGEPLLGPVEEWRSVLSEDALTKREILDRLVQITFVEDLPGTDILRANLLSIDDINVVFYAGKAKAA